MALNQSALIDLLKELELTETTERIRMLTQRAFQELINAEAATVIGAAPYERSSDRMTQRNGTRPRTLSTTAGDLDLRIPKQRNRLEEVLGDPAHEEVQRMWKVYQQVVAAYREK